MSPTKTRLALLTAGACLASSLSPQSVADDQSNPFGVTTLDPSRCYWLDGRSTPEGLCGEKLTPNVPLITKQAEAGNTIAAMRLGQLYSTGRWGVKEDLPKAVYWLERAARGGQRDAQIRVAQAYEFGRIGLERDLHKAIEFYQMATEWGIYPDLEERLENLQQRVANGS